MDLDRIRKWTWAVSSKIKNTDRKALDRFLMDLRSSTMPEAFSNTIVNHMTVFNRAGIPVGEIPFDLQSFSNVTEFKKVKAVVLSTIFNCLVKKNFKPKAKT